MHTQQKLDMVVDILQKFFKIFFCSKNDIFLKEKKEEQGVQMPNIILNFKAPNDVQKHHQWQHCI